MYTSGDWLRFGPKAISLYGHYTNFEAWDFVNGNSEVNWDTNRFAKTVILLCTEAILANWYYGQQYCDKDNVATSNES